MSYTIEQKIKGRIYLYKVYSYWDKDKKQSRQKRVYIGPKHAKKSTYIKQIDSGITHKGYGNIFLLNHLVKKIDLHSILEECFPDDATQLIAMAMYEIINDTPLYLFPYWVEEHYLPKVKKMDSSALSKFCNLIGRSQDKRINFQKKWINHLQPVEALFYDITSISSYSTKIECVEWGYNRDRENLAQLNLGVVFCNKGSLPIFYNIFPGSIVDVTTLKNCITYLKIYGLREFLFVLDKGFFSAANLLELTKTDAVTFIQLLPFSLKKVTQLIKVNKRQLHRLENVFDFNSELLAHTLDKITFEDQQYEAHIFLNEKAELDQKQTLIKALIDIETKIIKNKTFRSLKQAIKFKENNIPKKHQPSFKWNKSTGLLERNFRIIKQKSSKMGYFILCTNDEKINKKNILKNYRDKDQVEKGFDLLKNEMDGNRLRSHGQYNTESRLFIKFLALIIQSELVKVMKEKQLFKKYTVRELLAELKKIKRTQLNDTIIISEISKKQRQIFKHFDINTDMIHRY